MTNEYLEEEIHRWQIFKKKIFPFNYSAVWNWKQLFYFCSSSSQEEDHHTRTPNLMSHTFEKLQEQWKMMYLFTAVGFLKIFMLWKNVNCFNFTGESKRKSGYWSYLSNRFLNNFKVVKIVSQSLLFSYRNEKDLPTSHSSTHQLQHFYLVSFVFLL